MESVGLPFSKAEVRVLLDLTRNEFRYVWVTYDLWSLG